MPGSTGNIDIIKGALSQYDTSVEIMDIPGFKGTQSMFNPYVVFSMHAVGQNSAGEYEYTKHYDMVPGGMDQSNLTKAGSNWDQVTNSAAAGTTSPTASATPVIVNSSANPVVQQTPSIPINPHSKMFKAPTAQNLIEYSRNIDKVYGYGPAPYSWADFLYCKYYGEIPNNHLVTLRRYSTPMPDSAALPNGRASIPVAQAVTWFGEETNNKLSDLLKMTYGVIWKEVEATVQEVEGNEKAFGSGVEAFAGQKAVSTMGSVLTATRGSYDLWSGRQEKQQDWARKAYTNDGPYWNQIYGPVNVVHKSHMRERGVTFSHEINLNFHYKLRSYNGVNPKIAMLDLITNFLVLTYTNAKFWGGATRYFPNSTFRVGFLGDQSKFYSGDYSGYAESVGSEMKSTFASLSAGLEKIMAGDFSSLMSTVTKLVGGSLSEKSMPNMLSVRSMLSGDPVGEWHLTIGNPMNPIAVIGNLILMDTTITFGETLGADDFPTEVTFTVKLKPGKPRDKGDIESMFNSGYGRMSYAPMSTLPSAANTFGKKTSGGIAATNTIKSDPNRNLQQDLYDSFSTNGSLKDNTMALIKKRVTSQWGETFGNSANLLFMINTTKSRF